LPISAGTTKTLTLKANLIQFASDYAGGNTVSVSTGPVLTGIDSNSNVVSADGSTVTGNTQHIYIEAPVFAYVTSSATVSGSSASNTSDIGNTAITFSVTANGSDIYIATKATTAEALKGTLAGYVATTTTSTTWSCVSPADDSSNSGYWKIPQGQTANCTYSTLITNTGGTAGYYSVALDTVTWATTATTTGAIAQTYGLTNIKTADFALGI